MKSLINKLGLVAVLMFLTSVLHAQSITISGKIVDSGNQALPGVSVIEDGTTNGVVSDIDGSYSIDVRNVQSAISFSCIGFETKTFTAAELSKIVKVVLKEDAIMLEEVVAIGYGSVKKEDLTGSVTAIKAEDINRGVITSADELLKGKLTGVQIIPGGGSPGASGTIRIRGAASLHASNDPLIVVDGVALAHSSLSSLNPNDIESFSVLKDASAAAIYGSRASNGVILVTTKQGNKNEKMKVSYTGSFSINQNPSKIDMMSAEEFKNTLKKQYGNYTDKYIGEYDTDWQDLVLKLAYSTEHNVSVSGGLKNMPYRASIGFNRSEGTIVGSWYNRGTAQLALSPSFFKDHLKVNVNGRLTFSDGYNANVLYSAAFFNPTMPAYFYNEDGSIDYDTCNGFFQYGTGRGKDYVFDQQANLNATNPLGTIYGTKRSGLTTTMVGNVSLDYKVHGFEDLRFHLSLAYEGRNSTGISGPKAGSLSSLTDKEAPGIGKYSESENRRFNKSLEFYANYNHDFNGHKVDVLAGYSYTHVRTHSYSETKFWDDYGDYKKDEIYGNPTPDDQENFLISFYGRANYSYKGRYLATFTLRDDASSRFSPKTRWGLFPSAALAWNAKEENFLKDSKTVSTLKARFGWGMTGQQNIGSNYPYLARYSTSTSLSSVYNMGDAGLVYYMSPSSYDSMIKWETTTTLNAGIDFGFLNDRISGNVDVYKRTTNDLLNNVTIPAGANFSNSLLTNVGSIENKGVEVALNFIPVSTKDWNVQIGLNGTFQDTKFTKLTLTDDPSYEINVGQIQAAKFEYLQRHKVGYAPYSFYVYQQVYDSEGKPVQNSLVDRNNDGKITSADRYFATTKNGKAIKPAPDFYYGLSFKMSYKNWDFGFNGHGSVGNWMFNDAYASNSSTSVNLTYSYLANFSRNVLRSGFTATNDTEQCFSDMFLENASFFRMDDINLGYNFKFQKSKLLMRLALSAQNVFVITNYSGVDPEATGVGGIDSSMWPRPRVYSLRASITF